MLLTCREPKCIYNNEASPLHTPCPDHRYRWGEDKAVVGYTHTSEGKEGMHSGRQARAYVLVFCSRDLIRPELVPLACIPPVQGQHDPSTRISPRTCKRLLPLPPLKSLKPWYTAHWQPKHVLCLFPSAFDKHKQNILRSSCEDPQRCRI